MPVVGIDGGAISGFQVYHNIGATLLATNAFAVGIPAYKTTQTAAIATLAQVSVPNDATPHVYRVSGQIDITVLGTASINLEVTYTDIGNIIRTCIIPLCAEAGTFAVAANTADSWKGTIYITAHANTVITVLTAGTFTGPPTYHCTGIVELVA